jgi:putative spermidine/putrescine transport system substrate-binding protein
MDESKLSRRRFLRLSATSGAAALLAACGASTTTAPPGEPTAAGVEPTTAAPAVASPTAAGAALPAAPAPGPLTAADAGGMEALVAAAQQEGQLTVIALPNDWANYGEIKEAFKSKYNITINDLNPDAGSAEELEAVKANAGGTGPQAPDVIDVGFAFGTQAKADGLTQPYKVETWDTIPESVKDADGHWYGDYYGVLSFAINKDVVTTSPQDWADLLKPEYKSQVALSGDPRVSSQAILSVYAAALANGGSLDNPQPGLEFFAKLNEAGNLLPIIGKQASFAKGETPVQIMWDYLALGGRDALAGNPEVEVVIPASSVFAGVYVQAISAYAPHPNAARLWMEFLYSDEGQLLWLKGYPHPIRYDDLVKRNVIPADLAAKLPPAELYAKAVFPSVAQLEAANKLITSNWDSVVKADIQAGP